MAKKLTFMTIAVIVAAMLAAFQSAKAENSSLVKNIPQKNGLYDIPGHPGLKVRVFVHYPHVKPGPAPAPSEVCKLADPDSSAVVADAGWKLPQVWKYNLYLGNVPSSIGAARFEQLTRNTFETWVNDTGVNVTVSKGDYAKSNQVMSADGNNLVTFGSAPRNALGVTYIFRQDGVLVGTDTILNQKMAWNWSDPSSWNEPTSSTTCAFNQSYDAQNILTHEVGHWMGLDDHYAKTYKDNTMYGYGSQMETKKDTLTRGDLEGLMSIYSF